MKCLRHKDYSRDVFEGIKHAGFYFSNHREIFRKLIGKRPYTITILIENLDSMLWRKKDYCKQTRIEKPSRYTELLYQAFYADFGERKAQEVYGGWLNKYRQIWLREHKSDDIDDYIVWNELEPRYKKNIFKRHPNHKELFKPRYYIDTERFYHLPLPFNKIDWRNSFDNIFVWQENDKKLAVRGGSGSSWQRQINSTYLYGYALINQHTPVPSSLFIYDRRNTLWFIKQFPSLCLPIFDVGSNYSLSAKEERRVLNKVRLFEWEINQESIEKISFIKKFL